MGFDIILPVTTVSNGGGKMTTRSADMKSDETMK